MPYDRFFLDATFQTGAQLFLEGDEAHHLMRVMRKQQGETVELVNGRNQLGLATVTQLEKRRVNLTCTSLIDTTPSSKSIILCQALPRLNRLDMIVEKGTELGMTQLWLFPGNLSEKKELSFSQLKRLEMISIAAMKQCGRLDLPKILLKPPLIKWEQPPYPPFTAYFGDTADSAPPLSTHFRKKDAIVFFIGPESGFSTEEEAYLRKINVFGVNLHTNILRTETASLAALSYLHILRDIVE